MQRSSRRAASPILSEGKQNRPLPAWMSLLPSNVNPHVKPPCRSVLRRMSFPSYFSFSPTFYMRPLEWPFSHDDYGSSDPQAHAQLSVDGGVTSIASKKQRINSSTDFADSLVYSAEPFSPPSPIPLTPTPAPKPAPTPTHTLPPSEKPPVQRSTINQITEYPIISVTTTINTGTYPSTTTSTTFRTPHGGNLHATSSITYIPSHGRLTNPTQSFTLHEPTIPSTPSTEPSNSPSAHENHTSPSSPCTPTAHQTITPPTPKAPEPNAAQPSQAQQGPSKQEPQTQASAANHPPFLKELSTFFAGRTPSNPKLILPSRAAPLAGRVLHAPRFGLQRRSACGSA
jgi:hypothetical protein